MVLLSGNWKMITTWDSENIFTGNPSLVFLLLNHLWEIWGFSLHSLRLPGRVLLMLLRKYRNFNNSALLFTILSCKHIEVLCYREETPYVPSLTSVWTMTDCWLAVPRTVSTSTSMCPSPDTNGEYSSANFLFFMVICGREFVCFLVLMSSRSYFCSLNLWNH